MNRRFSIIEASKIAQRAANTSVDHQHTQAMRSGNVNFEETNRELDLFDESSIQKKTQFFSTKHPDLIQKNITDHLTIVKIKPEVSAKKYKMKFEIQTLNQDGVNQVT